MVWKPLFSDEDHEYDVLRDGVPDYMLESIIEWSECAEILLCLNMDHYSFSGVEEPDENRRHQLVLMFDRKTKTRTGLTTLSTSSFLRKCVNVDKDEALALKYIDFFSHETFRAPKLSAGGREQSWSSIFTFTS